MEDKTNYYHELQEAEQGNVVFVFRNLCERLFSQIEKGEITIEIAANIIAGTMFIDAVEKNESLEDIAHCAGVLELPPHQLPKPQAVLYQELQDLVAQL